MCAIDYLGNGFLKHKGGAGRFDRKFFSKRPSREQKGTENRKGPFSNHLHTSREQKGTL